MLDMCPDTSLARMTDGNPPHDRPDYSGPFDPDFRYEDLSKEALVRLVREYALIVHLLDRSMCAAIGMKYGQEVVEELAIEEWRGASAPSTATGCARSWASRATASRRSSRCCSSTPGSRSTTWTCSYEIVDDHHGFFELTSCGALMDVEPWGERAITGMCHTIEDATFDPTAQAVNPKAHITPRAPAAARAGRPRAALPLGDHDRRRQRDARGAADHHDDPRHDRGDLPVPADARRHAPPAARRRSAVGIR